MDDSWHWRLVALWLGGYMGKDSRGLPVRRFLSGRYERIARNFLALAVDKGVELPWPVANKLARLLVTDDDGMDAYFGVHRKIELVNRRPGRVPEPRRDMHLFNEVEKGLSSGTKLEAVVADVAARFGVTRSEIFRVRKELYASNIILPFLTQPGLGRSVGQPSDGHQYGSLGRWTKSPIKLPD